jgi:hypothetical protein
MYKLQRFLTTIIFLFKVQIALASHRNKCCEIGRTLYRIDSFPFSSIFFLLEIASQKIELRQQRDDAKAKAVLKQQKTGHLKVKASDSTISNILILALSSVSRALRHLVQ